MGQALRRLGGLGPADRRKKHDDGVEEERAQLKDETRTKDASFVEGSDASGRSPSLLHQAHSTLLFCASDFALKRSFYMVVMLAAWMQGMEELAKLSVDYFYKDDLKLSPAQLQMSHGIVVFPFMVKPIWGFISDGFPIMGYRRKFYLMLFGFTASVMWVVMGVFVRTWGGALTVLLMVNLSTAFISVIAKALIVEHSAGASVEYASWLQAVFFGTNACASILANYMGGFLLQYMSKFAVMASTAVFPLLVVLACFFLHEETTDDPPSVMLQLQRLHHALTSRGATRRTPPDADGTAPGPSGRDAGPGTSSTSSTSTSRGPRRRHVPLYVPIVFMYFFMAMPNADGAMFFFYTNGLGFPPEFMGRIRLVGGICHLLGVILYMTFWKKVAYRKVLAVGLVVNVAVQATILLLVTGVNRRMHIPDAVFCLGDKALAEAVGTVSFFPILVLAARLCPKSVEGTLYALLMSVLNLGSMTSTQIGSLITLLVGVTPKDFSHLWILIVITLCCKLLPLPFMFLMLPASDEETSQGNADEEGVLNVDGAAHQTALKIDGSNGGDDNASGGKPRVADVSLNAPNREAPGD